MTQTPESVESTARKLLHHREREQPNPVASGDHPPPDSATAYAVQDCMERILVAERGYRTIGYKIGAINAASRKNLGATEPFLGRLYEQLTLRSPARLDFKPEFFRIHEPEIVVQMDRDLDPARAPFDAGAIEKAARAVLPAIEIVATRFVPWNEAGALNLIADNAAHGWWILGSPVTDWSNIDLMDGTVALTVNGGVKGTGKGRNVDGGPFGATAWLANTLAARGRGLKAGEYVTTGSTVTPFPVAPGQSLLADFGALGIIELRVDAGGAAAGEGA